MNFLFILEQKLKNIRKSVLDLNQNALTMMEFVHELAPETVCNNIDYCTDWIIQIWIDNPSDENRLAYKLARNSVTSKIRNAERNVNFEKLGNNLST